MPTAVLQVVNTANLSENPISVEQALLARAGCQSTHPLLVDRFHEQARSTFDSGFVESKTCPQ